MFDTGASGQNDDGHYVRQKIRQRPPTDVYGFIQRSLNRLMPRRPNRLYKLLTRGRGRQDWLALAGWSLLALPLLPFAILESVLSELSSRGATLTIYARNREGDRQVADVLDP